MPKYGNIDGKTKGERTVWSSEWSKQRRQSATSSQDRRVKTSKEIFNAGFGRDRRFGK